MNLIKKFKNLSRRKKILFVVLFLAVIVLSAGLALGWFKKETLQKPPEAEKYYSQLTGEEVSKDISERPLLAVMIENSEEARPQSGLDTAGIVFETVTEGGITRYTALFQEDYPKNIGPIRSLRPAFVNWITGLDASVAHVGGSATALSMVDKFKTKSLNQFFNPEPYERIADRAAPHNVYAKGENLADLQKEMGHKKSEIEGFARSDDGPAAEPQAKKITIDFSGPVFAVEFRYDSSTNSYKRFLAGSPHIDANTKKQITVKNLVVLKISGNHSDNLRVTGKGEAIIFKDGNVIRAKWQQEDENERIKLVDEMGNEINLNRGDTWFAGLPNGRPLKF